MNLKLVRTTRTPYSEEISIYDVDTRDADNEPVKLGKLDLHYVDDQVVGTLLIWQEYAQGYRQLHTSGIDESLEEVIDSILTEISEPVGVSATYAVEVYYPAMSGATPGPGFVSNYPDDEDDDDGEAGDSTGDEEAAEYDEETGETGDEDNHHPGDDFADRLRQRP